MMLADADELMRHLLVDLLWKAGIVGVLLAAVVLAAVIIWKRVGRR